MEAGYSYCDNHSDRDSDKLGNGIVYAMMIEERGVIFLALLSVFYKLKCVNSPQTHCCVNFISYICH